MKIISNQPMFWLRIKIGTPSAKNAVDQKMSTDSIDGIINRLESIINYLKRQYKDL